MANSRNNPCIESLGSRVLAFLQAAGAYNARITVALSGGVDSVVLLHVLADIRAATAIQLDAVHFDHGIHHDSQVWATHCEALCTAWGVPLQCCKLSIPLNSKEGIEAAARRMRYAVLDSHETDFIALAHHGDDQAETLLLNLARGAGVKGAAAMLPVNGRYLRPLLSTTRLRLENYARTNSLNWIEDPSNDNTDFTRNFIRHEVLGSLQRRFPELNQNLAKSAAHFAEAQLLLDDLAALDLAGHAPSFPIPAELLSALSSARATNLIRHLISNAGLQAPPAIRLKEWLRQVRTAGPDRHPEVKFGGWMLRRSRRNIHLHRCAP